jgi:predicted amidophosphoribosyltransferase
MVKVIKSQYPGICNGCARPVVYIVTTGIHSLKLCKSCAEELKSALSFIENDDVNAVSYDHMKEVSHDPNVS